MQGTWKEKVGGWNHKGQRRKKQSRKHTLKDKAKALLKRYDYYGKNDDTIHSSVNVTTFVVEPVCKKSGFVSIYKYGTQIVYIKDQFGNFGNLDDILEHSSYLQYKFYDVYTDMKTKVKNLERVTFLYKEEVQYKTPLMKGFRYMYRVPKSYNDITIYGKPVDTAWKYRRKLYSKFKKHHRKTVNARRRAGIRQWLKRGDYDTDAGLGKYEKSIKGHLCPCS